MDMIHGLLQKLRDIRLGWSNSENFREAGSLKALDHNINASPRQSLHADEQSSVLSPTLTGTPSLGKSKRVLFEVWNEAYNDLKEDEPGIVDAYERILSSQLETNTPVTEIEGCPENLIKTTSERQYQLKRLIEEGQARRERAAVIKGKINNVVEPFNHLRSVISLAVKNEPVASIAWVGVTALLDVSDNYLLRISFDVQRVN